VHLGLRVPAEPWIAEARAGNLPPAPGWAVLRDAVTALPPTMQHLLVLSCVHGRDDACVAALLDCPEPEAAGMRAAVLARMGEIAGLARAVPLVRDGELG
jgi:hypothetical protein